jgi:hypothetical protein
MTIKATYTSKDYEPGCAVERFARATWPSGYAWCERDALNARYDVRQGTCDAADLPADVRERADARLSHAFSYVEWPLK